MELLYRKVAPAYKGIQSQPPSSGLLSGLSSLVGCGPAPVYRTADGSSVQAPAPCWWLCRVLAVTPHYKTAEPRVEEVERCAVASNDGDVVAEPAPGGAGEATQVVIL
jgi:hypothetical protein